MILADKIIHLRKKGNMTQEDLASEIGVSRQSVSKRESQMAMPDLDKIMKLAKIFGVTTDFLLNDDLGLDHVIVDENSEDSSHLIDLPLLNEYFDGYETIARSIALAIPLIIISPFPVLALGESKQGLGIVLMLVLVALAVGIFINAGFVSSKFDFIEKESYSFSYGVEGIIEKKKAEYEPKLKRNIIVATAIFILAPTVFFLLENTDVDELVPVYIFLLFISFGAGIAGYAGVKYSSYRDILKYRNPHIQKKEGKMSKASGILWMLTIGLYLAYSYSTGNWHISWIIFVIAGFIQGAIAIFFD